MKYILLILAVTTCSVLSLKKDKPAELIVVPDPIQEEIESLNEWLSR